MACRRSRHHRTVGPARRIGDAALSCRGTPRTPPGGRTGVVGRRSRRTSGPCPEGPDRRPATLPVRFRQDRSRTAHLGQVRRARDHHDCPRQPRLPLLLESMMKPRHLLLTVLLLSGCASKGPPELRGADYYFEEGGRDFERRRFLEAVESFQRIVSNFPGHARVAEAQYYLAESYFGMEEFVSAAFEYERVVDTYPSSQWRDDAQYKIGESYLEQSRRAELDQSETYEALNAYRRFIEDNVDSPLVVDARTRIGELRSRLAKKQFLASRLYHRQGHLRAARMAYEQLLAAYPLTSWYWHGLAQLGDIARVEGEIDEARGHWQEVLQGAEEEKLLDDVRQWVAELDLE
ncbi:MAG: hypothetical protein CME04_07510 [Gemmatimonadaceae bacterium]|nr:hypothetical protein [Gemmatimonadaceae bacterium]